MSRRMWWIMGCCSAAAGVALGAFGAHGLKNRISDTALLGTWQTATFYHFMHAFGLILVAVSPKQSSLAGWSFVGGTLLFSGSLYALVLSNQKWLGAITPFGGGLFIVGWLALGLLGL